MQRREMLKASGAALLGLSALAAAPAGKPKKKVLFFTRNVGYYHAVVDRKGKPLAHAEKALVELGGDAEIEVVCSKDGRLFDGDLTPYDAFVFYANEDLTAKGRPDEPPMTAAGKQRFLDAVAGGKGFLGVHSTCNCWFTPGKREQNNPKVDPFIAMLGGEFVSHGPQQEGALTWASRALPELEELGMGEGLAVFDEWYALKNFAKDLHVFLVQETQHMKGACYRRPPYPCTWARPHGKGRVFFTSMGHTDEVWLDPMFRAVLLAGMNWTTGRVEAHLPPNLAQAAPHADKLHNDAK